MAAKGLYIGIMSGTSTDGIDAVLARFSRQSPPKVMAQTFVAMPSKLRKRILELNTPGNNEIDRAAKASIELASLYAQASQAVLKQSGHTAHEVHAIGAHGQTIRHHPEAGYSLQLNAPAHLAEQTGIAVIADFRSRDIAAGGQGAPLVPAFHHVLFSGQHIRVVLNLGGIANITVLHADGKVSGFDTGPANMLLDAWIQRHRGKPYDHDGCWAASAQASQDLLHYLIQNESWLQQSPPKSTGRHLFNLKWLDDRLDLFFQTHSPLEPASIQATLLQLSAHTIAQAIASHVPQCAEVIVCGGGALNSALMQALNYALSQVLPGSYLFTRSSDYGIPVDAVEALAFAWLAYAFENKIPAGLPLVTGAHSARILGCKYPA